MARRASSIVAGAAATARRKRALPSARAPCVGSDVRSTTTTALVVVTASASSAEDATVPVQPTVPGEVGQSRSQCRCITPLHRSRRQEREQESRPTAAVHLLLGQPWTPRAISCSSAAFHPELARRSQASSSAPRCANASATSRSWRARPASGLPMAAAGCAMHLAELRPRAAIAIGTCGAYAGSGLEIGDVVVARRVRLVDPAALRDEAQFPDPMRRRSSRPTRRSVDDASPRGARGRCPWIVATTLAITVNDGVAEQIEGRATGASAEHLEAYAIATACAARGIPFCAVLGVANLVGSRARELSERIPPSRGLARRGERRARLAPRRRAATIALSHAVARDKRDPCAFGSWQFCSPQPLAARPRPGTHRSPARSWNEAARALDMHRSTNALRSVGRELPPRLRLRGHSLRPRRLRRPGGRENAPTRAARAACSAARSSFRSTFPCPWRSGSRRSMSDPQRRRASPRRVPRGGSCPARRCARGPRAAGRRPDRGSSGFPARWRGIASSVRIGPGRCTARHGATWMAASSRAAAGRRRVSPRRSSRHPTSRSATSPAARPRRLDERGLDRRRRRSHRPRVRRWQRRDCLGPGSAGGGELALQVDARTALTAKNALPIAYGKRDELGDDAVVFVGGPGDRRTRAALAVPPVGPGWSLLPIATDIGSFGLAIVRVDAPPRVDEPAVWAMYPNGLDPAPVAAA